MEIIKIEPPYPVTLLPCMCGEVAYPYKGSCGHLLISCTVCGLIKHAKKERSLIELIEKWNHRPAVEELKKEIEYLKKQNKSLLSK